MISVLYTAVPFEERPPMAKRKRRRPESPAAETPPPTKRKSKFLRRLFVLMLLLVGLLAATPTILSNTSLRNQLAGYALPDAAWKIETDAANLGWTSSQSLSGLKIIDAQGQAVITAETISCDRSLLEIATNWNNLGKIQIVNPTVTMTSDPEGSSVEQLLSSKSDKKSAPEQSDTELFIELEIVDGAANGVDPATQQPWSLTNANLLAQLSGDINSYQIQGNAKVNSTQADAKGQIRFRMLPAPEGGQQLDLLAENFPLQILQPLAAQHLPGAQLSGIVTIDAPQVRLVSDSEQGLFVESSGRLEASKVAFSAEALAGDQLFCQEINAPWKIRFAGGNLSIQQFNLDAGWAKLSAKGMLPLGQLNSLNLQNLPRSEMSIIGNIALDRLAAMLPNTLKIREGVRIDSGQLEALVEGKPSAGKFNWIAEAKVQNLAGRNNGRVLRWEKPLEAVANFSDSAQGPRLEQVSVTAPFANARFAPNGKGIVGNFQLDLDQLTQEIGQFVDMSTLQLQGRGEGEFIFANLDTSRIESDTNIQFTNLHVANKNQILWAEPKLQLQSKFKYDSTSGTIAAPQMQLVGSSVSFLARDLELVPQSIGGSTAKGRIAFRTDLERLSAAAGLISQGDATWPRGQVEGQIQLTSQNGQVLANFSTTTSNLQLLENKALSRSGPEVLWNEPQLQFSGSAKYEPQNQSASFDNLQIVGKTLQLNGKAALENLDTKQNLQAEGQIQYDDAELSKLLVGYFGPEVQIQGDRQLQFQVAGPLADLTSGAQPLDWIREWQLNAGAGWQQASLYGLEIGVGQLAASLQQGQVQITPIDFAIGQGRLTAKPQVSLKPGAEQVFLVGGPLLTNVQVSPEVSQTILKYVAPVLAGATRTEGKFSVTLNDSQVPLRDPKKSNILGQLSVHQLRIMPGPLMRDLESTLKQLKSLSDSKELLNASTQPHNSSGITIQDRNIDFQVAQERVYHRNLVFEIDGVPVSSHGSVGFDQTLALVFEVTLQEKWLGKALRTMAGETVQIPVQGTFQNPQLDPRAVANLSQRLLQNAAGNILQDEVNRQLEKLFRGR